MLTGKPPWFTVTKDQYKTFDLVMSGRVPPFPKNIHAECQSFLELCLKKNPAERASASELLKHPFITKHINKSKEKVKLLRRQREKIQLNKLKI